MLLILSPWIFPYGLTTKKWHCVISTKPGFLPTIRVFTSDQITKGFLRGFFIPNTQFQRTSPESIKPEHKCRTYLPAAVGETPECEVLEASRVYFKAEGLEPCQPGGLDQILWPTVLSLSVYQKNKKICWSSKAKFTKLTLIRESINLKVVVVSSEGDLKNSYM